MRPSRIALLSTCMLLTLAFTAYSGNHVLSLGKHSWTRVQEKGSGVLETETRNLPNFTEIETSISVDLKVTVGQEQKVTVRYDDNLLDNVTTKVHGKTLEIDADGSFSSEGDCIVEITIPKLDGIDCSGSGHIEIYNLDNEEFSFELSGSGSLQADGKVKQLYVDITGSGEVDMRNLEAEDAEVDISGSGDAVINATNSLDGEISGSGNIRYLKEPEHLSTHVSGSGTIRRGR